jgi:hypothetical protein
VLQNDSRYIISPNVSRQDAMYYDKPRTKDDFYTCIVKNEKFGRHNKTFKLLLISNRYSKYFHYASELNNFPVS